MSFDGFRDEFEYISVLLTAGFDGCQQCFHEATTGGALRAKGEFAPDHGVTE